MRDARILLTGHTGFIGAALFARLQKTHQHIYTLSRRELQDIPGEKKGERIRAKMEAIKPDLIIHAATFFSSRHPPLPDSMAPMLEANVFLGNALMQAAVECGCLKFLNLGSFWEKLAKNDPKFATLYSLQKRHITETLKMYAARSDLHVINLLLCDTYGPNDPRGKILSVLLQKAKTGENIALGSKQQLLSFVHVDDVVDALILCLEEVMRPVIPGYTEYGLRAETLMPMKTVVEEIEALAQKQLNVTWLSDAPQYDAQELFRNIKVPPGWRQRVDFAEGLQQLLDRFPSS